MHPLRRPFSWYAVGIFTCLLVFGGRDSWAQGLYYPPLTGSAWNSVTPAQLGWCPAGVDSVVNYAAQQDSKALLILHQGRMVVEEYFGAFTADSLWYWASAGKTLTAGLVGQAVAAGEINPALPSSTYLGAGWSSLTAQQEAVIHVWDHLKMTTGLNDGVPNPDCILPSCLQYLAPAGTRWAYHNAPYTLLDSILINATGQSLNGLVQSRIRPQTGIQGFFYPFGDNNVFVSKPRSMARYGLLIQGHGRWNGAAVLDSSWVHAMTTPSQSINPAYGLLWWLNGQSAYRLPQTQILFPGPLMPNAPADAVAALGRDGQILFVVPSLDLVVVRMGNNPTSVPVPWLLADELWKRLNLMLCLAQSEGTGKLGKSLQVIYTSGESYVELDAGQKLRGTDALGRTVFDLEADAAGRVYLPENLPAGWWALRADDGRTARWATW
jgi:CubicO group peptidase (beta-lactamase class C family)